MTTNKRIRRGMRYAAVAAVAATLAGCATAPPAKPLPWMHTAPAGSQVLWKDGVQYVALTPPASAGAPASDQPVTFKAAQLGKALGQLKVQWGQDPSKRAVFTAAALKRLTPHLAQAFGKAGPHQDVTFAVITRGPLRHGTLIGMRVRHPSVTTVRAFYRHDRLNMIFGLVHARFAEEYMNTGHLRPMPPGQRDGELQGGFGIVGAAGLKHPQSGRPDWVSVALKPVQPKPQPQPIQSTAQPSPAPVAASPKASKSQQPASLSSGSANQEYQSIARRLRVLDKLHRQGLISNREYRNKRRQILSGL